MNYLKAAVSGMDREDITQERFIADSTAWHGKRATVNIQNYQIERLWKQNYILVNVIAEGYDQKRFLEQMVKAKSKFCQNILICGCRHSAKRGLFHERGAKNSCKAIQRRCE